jgi:two-component system LytT family response regulator
MIKAVLIDDEKIIIESLGMLLSEHCPDVEVIATADSYREGIRILDEYQPDLIFLDIEMPHGSGFELLERFPDRNFDVIFVTAHSHYAIKAFKFSAVDYILKPVDIQELIQAVGRIKRYRNLERNTTQRYRILQENLKAPGPTRLAVPTSKGMDFIHIDDILRIQADGRYSTIFTRDNRNILVARNLGQYSKLLSDGNFFRSHHSHLINIDHIKKYLHRDGGTIILRDGSRVPLARSRKADFLRIMQAR